MPGGWVAMEERPEADRVAMPAGVVPPMVTAEEFAAVRRRLAANRAQASRNNRDPEATLLRGGFARCGYCGGALQVERDRRAEGGNGPTYVCGTTNSDRFGCPPFAIAAPLLDGAVWERVLGVLRDPGLIAREAARRRHDDRFAADLDIVVRGIADVEKRQTNLTRLLSGIEDADAAAPLVAELRNLSSQKKELTVERKTLEVGQAAQRADQERLFNLTEWCGRVTANLDSLTYPERRDVLAALGVSARVWRKDHTPRWEITMDVRELELASDGSPIVSPTVGACGSL
jgi:site-specific DNA recombinase